MFRLKYKMPSSGPHLLNLCIFITTKCLSYIIIVIIIIINAVKINIAVSYNLTFFGLHYFFMRLHIIAKSDY